MEYNLEHSYLAYFASDTFTLRGGGQQRQSKMAVCEGQQTCVKLPEIRHNDTKTTM